MSTRSPFGTTWWGSSWVHALEESAALDPGRLTRGRKYARDGSVGPLELGPGFASARVTGSHGRFYRTDVAVKTLAPTEWDQVADAIAARAGHAAALLDGELDPGIVADAAECDIRLLPGAGDLRPDCSCPDWAEPCKHAAAVCYLVANELDRDPFALFLLRGLSRDDLLAMVRERRGGEAPASGPTDALGVEAIEAWAERGFDVPLAPIPDVVAAALVVPSAGYWSPPHWDVDLSESVGIGSLAIDGLADDAAERAWAMLADESPSGLDGSFEVDLARRAALIEPSRADRLARELGWTPQRLAALVEAWELGGAAGVQMVVDDDSWSTDQAAVAEGRERLGELGYSRRSVSLNYDSLRMRDNVFLALAPDGRWYKLQARGRRQEMHLAAAPADDVGELVDPAPPA